MNYKLLPAQREFLKVPHNEEMDIALYQGGYGSGKTWSGSWLGCMLCQKYPGILGLVGAQTYKLVKDTTLREYLKHLDNFKIAHKYNKSDGTIKFPNSSEILFRHFDNPDDIKSLSLGFCEIEEMSDVPESTFNMILGRMRQSKTPEWIERGFKYRIFGHTNPEQNKGWVYKNFFDNSKLSRITYIQDGKELYYDKCDKVTVIETDDEPINIHTRAIVAPSVQNIHLPKIQLAAMKSAYDAEYYKINVLGQNGDYSKGLVTKGFSDKNKADIKYDRNRPIYIACDFNVDPMCWVLAHLSYKQDENKQYILDESKEKIPHKAFFFDEIVVENTTTSKTIDELYSRLLALTDNNINFEQEIIITGDSSGSNRSTQSEYHNYTIMINRLSELGFKNVRKKLRDSNGLINRRVSAWNAKILNVNGDIGIHISNKCKWLIYNIENLKYKEGTSLIDVPTQNQIKNDRNSKFLSHIFDAASYLVNTYFPIKKEDN